MLYLTSMGETKHLSTASTMMEYDKHQKHRNCITDNFQNPIIGREEMEGLFLVDSDLTQMVRHTDLHL